MDIAVLSEESNGVNRLKMVELRTSVNDLDGQEHWYESSRAERAEALYASKNRAKRLEMLTRLNEEKYADRILRKMKRRTM